MPPAPAPRPHPEAPGAPAATVPTSHRTPSAAGPPARHSPARAQPTAARSRHHAPRGPPAAPRRSAPSTRSPPAPRPGQPAATPHQHQDPPRPPRSTANTFSNRKSRTPRQRAAAHTPVEARAPVTRLPNTYALSKVSEIAQSNNRLYSASGTYGAKKPMSSLREEKLVISSANESARGHSSAERYGAKPRRVSFRARFWKSSSSPSSLSADAESIANTERLARVPSETSGTNLARAKARVYPSGSCRHSLSTWSNNPGDLPSPRFDIASPIS